jgi:hypothetical protein
MKKLSSRSPNKTRDKDLSNKRLLVSTTFLAHDRGGRFFNGGSNTTKVHDNDNSLATSSSFISRSIKDKKPGSSFFKNNVLCLARDHVIVDLVLSHGLAVVLVILVLPVLFAAVMR